MKKQQVIKEIYDVQKRNLYTISNNVFGNKRLLEINSITVYSTKLNLMKKNELISMLNELYLIFNENKMID